MGLRRPAHVCYIHTINFSYSDCDGYLTCIIKQSISSYLDFFPTKGDNFMSTAAGSFEFGRVWELRKHF